MKNNFIYFNAGFAGEKPVVFENPSEIITCNKPAQITSKLGHAQKLIDNGFYLAGYFSYELGHYLQEKAGRPFKSITPLFYLAAYKYALTGRHAGRPLHGALVGADPCVRPPQYELNGVLPDTGVVEYRDCFNRIKALIKSGEIYQVNECFKLKFNFKGSAQAFFADLCSRQEADYAAFINDGQRQILSISPELFFSIRGKQIIMKPMKGTALKSPGSRVQSPESALKNEKNRAENIMIVDLIRNDLGKICETNTVKAGPLFEVKEYKTLYQMTSTVKGTLKKDVKVLDLLKALFPSGSVTGAPKIRAMQVIKDTEKSARGIYTGAVGFIGPKMKTAVFNIPIRTVIIDKKGKAEMGIGSGIVHDSKPASEYEECLGKAKFLFPSLQGASLIESLLLKNGKYFLLSLHLKRLMKSAAYFGVPVDKEEVKRTLLTFGSKLRKGSYKVRLLVDADGKLTVSGKRIVLCRDSALRCPTGRAAVSMSVMNSNDIFLRHKTMRREVYDAEYNKYLKKGFSDVIFFNERGELTEAHSSNVFVKKNGIFYTPPVSCGLLPGTYRDFLLAKGRKYKEKVLYKKDLMKADAVYICNSVRGIRLVVL